MTQHIKCSDPITTCEGCAKVATALGINLAEPHRSCRQVTVTNIIAAAQHMSSRVDGFAS